MGHFLSTSEIISSAGGGSGSRDSARSLDKSLHVFVEVIQLGGFLEHDKTGHIWTYIDIGSLFLTHYAP